MGERQTKLSLEVDTRWYTRQNYGITSIWWLRFGYQYCLACHFSMLAAINNNPGNSFVRFVEGISPMFKQETRNKKSGASQSAPWGPWESILFAGLGLIAIIAWLLYVKLPVYATATRSLWFSRATKILKPQNNHQVENLLCINVELMGLLRFINNMLLLVIYN